MTGHKVVINIKKYQLKIDHDKQSPRLFVT